MYDTLLMKYMDQIRPVYTCEWGSGKSTDIILSYDCVKAHVVIEDDEGKHQRLIKQPRMFAYYVPDNLDLYVNYPYTIAKDLHIEYKFMFINGKEKLRCIEQAKKALHMFGAAVLHEAQRIKYMEAINTCFPVQEWDRPENESFTVGLKPWKYGDEAKNRNK